MSAGFMFLITQDVDTPASGEGFEIPEDQMDSYIHRTIWLIAISLSVIMISMTIQALLDTSVDPPGTLLVNNRYVRLSGRIVYVVVILLLPIHPNLDKDWFLGITAVLMSFVMCFEWIVCLERNAGMFEPKGLTVLMKRALGSRNLSKSRSRARQD
jgi:ABC-type Fe3+-siderophore transport system permease subunit